MTQADPRVVLPPSLRSMAVLNPASGTKANLTHVQAEHFCESLANWLHTSPRVPVKADISKDADGMTIRLSYTRPAPTIPQA